jgi:hypothetical protein
VELGEVLAMLQVVEQVLALPFLPVCECLEHAMFLQQPGDVRQALVETVGGAS